jgi:putative DNA primase/helicase
MWKHFNGKKPPVDRDGRLLAGWNEPENFLTHATAMAWAFDPSKAEDYGVGFVLGDGWGGLDLDESRDPKTGKLVDKAAQLLAAFPGAYVEISPSGSGVKLFGLSDVPGFLEWNAKTGAVEIKNFGYFTVTGKAYNGAGDGLPQLNYAGLAAMLGSPIAEKKTAAPPLPAVVPPGSQEGAMYREGCRLRRLGYSGDEIAKMLWMLVEQGRFPAEPGREPWNRADCEAKARAAEKHAPAQDPYPTTDPGCAEFLKATQGDLIRHDVDRGLWLLFDDVRWASDQIERIKLHVTESLRARRGIASTSGSAEKRRAELLKNENRVPSILTAAVPYFPARTTEFDTDPYLLGVPNGVVDLRSGVLRSSAPDDGISMQTAFAYDPEAKCPLWDQTVASVFAKDGIPRTEFVGYVQRALGYSITGACDEEVFFLCTGQLGDDEKNGRNGKGTLLNTVAKVLGDYAGDLGFSSLEWQKNSSGAGSASPDLAKLVHKRFVTASETNRGSKFNTARIKALTGRDPISARFLYRNEFTFTPEIKLWLSVNFPPQVDDDSLGFWSRPHVIEYPNTFADTADTTLKDRLILEGKGILAWLVRGAVAWQNEGLNPPSDVRLAVQKYQRSQGDLDEFLESCCVVEESASATYGELWEVYSRWTQAERRHKISSKAMGKRLRERFGLPTQKKDGHRKTVLSYQGVGIGTPTETLF